MDSLTLSLLRIGQAVRAVGLEEARMIGLTPIQAQSLMFVRDTKRFATTIGALARRLGASHASTVDVVNALVGRGLLAREPSSTDRRVTLLRLTVAGEEATTKLELWGRLLSQALSRLSEQERADLERGLGAVIWSLREAGHLDVAEPCRGCVHFREDESPGATQPHYCALITRFLDDSEAKLDCPEHEPLTALA